MVDSSSSKKAPRVKLSSVEGSPQWSVRDLRSMRWIPRRRLCFVSVFSYCRPACPTTIDCRREYNGPTSDKLDTSQAEYKRVGENGAASSRCVLVDFNA